MTVALKTIEFRQMGKRYECSPSIPEKDIPGIRGYPAVVISMFLRYF